MAYGLKACSCHPLISNVGKPYRQSIFNNQSYSNVKKKKKKKKDKDKKKKKKKR